MPPKRDRLTTTLFKHFFKTGKRFHGRYCTLVYTPHDTRKISVVVGKKVYKRAVDRNRLRRQLYSIVSSYTKEHNCTGVFQCLVKPAAAAAPVASVKYELQELLARAHNPR